MFTLSRQLDFELAMSANNVLPFSGFGSDRYQPTIVSN
jgi:hypothetical protein